MELQKILDVVNKMEKDGVGFYARQGNHMTIFITGKHGNDHNQWINADKIASDVGSRMSPIPDPQSGHLILRLRDVYEGT